MFFARKYLSQHIAMPEGPEITTFADYLRRILRGRYVVKATIVGPKSYTLQRSLATPFKKLFDTPRRCTGVYKKGKFMYFGFEPRPAERDRDGLFLGAGMGMAGQWNVLYPSGRIINAIDSTPLDTGKDASGKYNNIMANPRFEVFHWEVRDAPRGKLVATIIFHDHRHFSKWYLLTLAKLHARLDTLGPDVMGPMLRPGDKRLREEDILRLDKLVEYMATRRGDITALLNGQKAISGIGNHMKDEILYDARVWPGAKKLDKDRMANVLASARRIAARFTKDIKSRGVKGIRFYVYMRDEDPHGNAVKASIFDDRRTTYWVPAVQRIGK